MPAKEELMKMFLSKDFVSRYRLAEQVTGPFARVLVDHSGVAQSSRRPLVILDNACGTGVVGDALYHSLDPSARDSLELTCGDISPGLVKYIEEKIQDVGWKNAQARLVDAQDTGLPSHHYTHTFMAFGKSIRY